MLHARDHHLAAARAHDVGDLIAVRSYHDALGDVHIDDALPNANDQRQAGEESERFSGETGRSQSGWDDGKRPHTGRSGQNVSAHSAANITFSNVALT